MSLVSDSKFTENNWHTGCFKTWLVQVSDSQGLFALEAQSQIPAENVAFLVYYITVAKFKNNLATIT